MIPLRGQQHAKHRPLSRLALHQDPPAVFVNDLRHNRQPQPHPARLRRKKRIENTLAMLRRNSRTPVNHRDFNEPIHRPRLHRNRTARRTRLRRIPQQVIKDPLHPLPVQRHRPQRRIVIFINAHIRPVRRTLILRHRPVDHFMHIRHRRLQRQRPRKLQKPRHQRVRPVHLARDVLRHLPPNPSIVFRNFLQHLRRHPNRSQRIPQLVRQPSRQLAQRRQPLGPPHRRLRLHQLLIRPCQFLRRLLALPRLQTIGLRQLISR